MRRRLPIFALLAVTFSAPSLAAADVAFDGVDPRVYLKARKPVPDVVRELKRAPLDVSERILRDGPDAFLVDAAAYPASLKSDAVAALRAAERRALVIGALAAAADKQRADLVLLHVANVDAAIRAEASERFGEARGDVAILERIARDDVDSVVRTAAVAGLGRHRSADALDALAPFVVDGSDVTRQIAAVRALSILGSKWAWEAQGDVATGARLREEARALLSKIVRVGELGRAVDDVERALR